MKRGISHEHLVTGGGLTWANFVRLALEEMKDCRLVNLDKLTYADITGQDGASNYDVGLNLCAPCVSSERSERA